MVLQNDPKRYVIPRGNSVLIGFILQSSQKGENSRFLQSTFNTAPFPTMHTLLESVHETFIYAVYSSQIHVHLMDELHVMTLDAHYKKMQ